MELREYYKIWRHHISVVIYVVLISIVAAYAWSVRMSESYSASQLLEISRNNFQSSSDYRYDQFYRLQADEKFAEAIEVWLKSAGVSRSILEKAELDPGGKTVRQLSKSFRPEKIASNVIRVNYSTQNEEEAKKLADSIEDVISEKTNALNAASQDPNWFVVESSDFVAARNRQDLRINLLAAILAGLFLGTLAAFGKHYITHE